MRNASNVISCITQSDMQALKQQYNPPTLVKDVMKIVYCIQAKDTIKQAPSWSLIVVQMLSDRTVLNKLQTLDVRYANKTNVYMAKTDLNKLLEEYNCDEPIDLTNYTDQEDGCLSVFVEWISFIIQAYDEDNRTSSYNMRDAYMNYRREGTPERGDSINT